jgi:hypothetical protein
MWAAYELISFGIGKMFGSNAKKTSVGSKKSKKVSLPAIKVVASKKKSAAPKKSGKHKVSNKKNK